MAIFASEELLISMNPQPFERPETRSRTCVTSLISPAEQKWDFSSSLVILKGKLPTYKVLDMGKSKT